MQFNTNNRDNDACEDEARQEDFEHFKWGQIELKKKKLPNEFVQQCLQLKSTQTAAAHHEPLLPSMIMTPDFIAGAGSINNESSLHHHHHHHSHYHHHHQFQSFHHHQQQQQQQQLQNVNSSLKKSLVGDYESKKYNNGQLNMLFNLQPSIDSYIMNTIKLNEILKNNISFDQVDFFKKQSTNSTQQQQQQKQQQSTTSPRPDIDLEMKITSDDDARVILRKFITIMAMHSGFTHSSSMALDILVDVLDHFLENFFKIFKNLQNVHLFDPNSNETTKKFYSTKHFVEQAFIESGVGTLKSLREFYLNDVIEYHRQTYKKVSKLYEDYKKRRMFEKQKRPTDDLDNNKSSSLLSEKSENEIKMDEFMRENDLLNDESDSILGDLLIGDLEVNHFDEEINKLMQIIGTNPFNLINDPVYSSSSSNQEVNGNNSSISH